MEGIGERTTYAGSSDDRVFSIVSEKDCVWRQPRKCGEMPWNGKEEIGLNSLFC